MKYPDFSNVELGQRVFSILHGWGKVVEKNFLGRDDLITVMFDRYRNRASFSIDGRSHGWEIKSVYPILYYDQPLIDKPHSAFIKPEDYEKKEE